MESRLDLDAALLKARVKARLLGWPEEPVQLGRFAIERCLGRGGVGAVYAARDGSTGTRVALKRPSMPAGRVRLSVPAAGGLRPAGGKLLAP